jgi:hypothetical protein
MKDGIQFGVGMLMGILLRFALFSFYVYLSIRTLQYFGVTI